MSEEIKNTSEASVKSSDSSISKSRAKREARAAEVKAAKVKKNFDAILGWVVGILLAAVVIGLCAMGLYKDITKTVSSSDYSYGLTEEGFVKGADLSGVTDLALEGMEIPYESVEYIDDKVDADLLEAASQYAAFNDDPSLTVANGHTINLDFAGTVDGVAFEGSTAEGQTLEIGSGSFIDNFEEQLIGSHPGDNVTVTVTFPDPYENNPDLAGKEAVFECKVNSIWKTPEINDEFVKAHYSDVADNLEDMKAYIKEQNYQSNIESYIANYVTEHASVSKIPSSYKKHLRQILKYTEEQTFEQYKTYMSYYGYTQASTMGFYDYLNMSEEAYEKELRTNAAKQAAMDLTYESIFKKAGLTVSDEDYAKILEYYGGEETALATYGEPYIKQTAIKHAVIMYLKSKAVIVNGVTE